MTGPYVMLRIAWLPSIGLLAKSGLLIPVDDCIGKRPDQAIDTGALRGATRLLFPMLSLRIQALPDTLFASDVSRDLVIFSSTTYRRSRLVLEQLVAASEHCTKNRPMRFT